MADHPTHRRPLGVFAVRRALPIGLLIAALVVAVVGPRGLAPGLVAAAAFVVVADWIIRIAFVSQTDRDREQDARNRFDESGHWPEDGPAGSPEPPPAEDDERDRHRHAGARPDQHHRRPRR